jgi:hypothetical protein
VRLGVGQVWIRGYRELFALLLRTATPPFLNSHRPVVRPAALSALPAFRLGLERKPLRLRHSHMTDNACNLP